MRTARTRSVLTWRLFRPTWITRSRGWRPVLRAVTDAHDLHDVIADSVDNEVRRSRDDDLAGASRIRGTSSKGKLFERLACCSHTCDDHGRTAGIALRDIAPEAAKILHS